MSDDDLIEGLRSRSFIAQQKFLEEYAPRLSEKFLNYFSDLTDTEIEDAIFDRLYYFINNPEKISLGRSIWSLLFVSVRNKITDVQRKQNNGLKQFSLDTVGRKASSQLIQEDTDEDGDSLNLYSRIPSEALYEAKALIAEMNLSVDEKEHLRLRLEEEFESKEIAEFLQIKPNAESVRWNRLMLKIRRSLDIYPNLKKYLQDQSELSQKI